MKNYSVSYEYKYSYKLGTERRTVYDFGSGVFHCKKQSLKKEIETYIMKEEIPFAEADFTQIEMLNITDIEN